ncbi:MAG: helix-turn-helix domain-containing protein [Pseudoruegeria sp.]
MDLLTHRIPEIRITPIPRLAQGGKWRVEAMRSYSKDLLLWFTRGQGRITIAGTTRGYGAHNAVFIPAGTMHGFEVSNLVYGSAVFIPRETTLTLPEHPTHLRIRDANSQSELSMTLDALQKELDGSRPDRIRAAHHHAGLLSVWLKRQILLHETDNASPDAGQKLLQRYTELVEAEYRSNKTVAEYAEILGVTPTHLSRVCNKACGRPASSILTDRVLFEARRLLTETDTPIKDVAFGLGFASAAYFTRAFQHHTGRTPSSFRNQTK